MNDSMCIPLDISQRDASSATNSHSVFSIALALALLVCSRPLTYCQASTSGFEVASIREAPVQTDSNTRTWSRPGGSRFTATHVSLALLIGLAYGIDDSQITHKPEWLETSLYDLTAQAEDGVNLTREELRPRLQALLQQRFHLTIHTEKSFSRGYALVVTPRGSRLLPTKGDQFPGFRINVSPGEMRGVNWSMSQFATYLTSAVGFPVVDQTGLSGSFDISFSYAPAGVLDSNLPQLPDAVKQATGLVLKPQKVPTELFVITSADKKPTEN